MRSAIHADVAASTCDAPNAIRFAAARFLRDAAEKSSADAPGIAISENSKFLHFDNSDFSAQNEKHG
jgi:hypothetical protein